MTETPVIIISLDSASACYEQNFDDNKISSGQDSVISSPERVYVNPKQYLRILKRRVSRAKLEAQWNIPKFRQKILHESRSKHARNRPRDDKGKFLKQEDSNNFKVMIETN